MHDSAHWKRLVESYEFCDEELSQLYESWYLSNCLDTTANERDTILKFINWARDELKHQLNEPRAPDGKSFLERAAEGS